MQIVLDLWLHREERDAWLVSRSGVGAGRFLPKSEIEIEDGHPFPMLHGSPVGPVQVRVPDWLAEKEGLSEREAEGQQGSLF